MGLFKSIFGDYSSRELKSIYPIADQIEALADEYKALSDAELQAKTPAFKERLANGETLDDILPEAFATVREAADRVLGLRPYRVQLIGGIVLHQGRIAEMKTGEGKTLVATLPAYLNALSGEGVHIVTVNDYLAKRDSEWMGKVHRFLGLTVGLIVHDMDKAARQAAYAADITYGTNNEMGFDYLRDNMALYASEQVQRGHSFAIVDEVDSILIDEARTPLIISGMGEKSTQMYDLAESFAARLKKYVVVETDDKEEEATDIDADYVVDEKAKTATLTARGIAKAEEFFHLENLSDPENSTIAHHINQAIRAHGIMKRDVDYVIKDGEIIIVDEFTGRLMFGRRYSEGLHQAIEAKEGVQVANESKTLATITFQNYFRMYDKLAGMTGTADTEAVEFHQIYNLEVVSIPPNKPMQRKDYPDLIYRTRKEKYDAIIEAIRELYEKGQPVLVGTISIETSEMLSQRLKKLNIPHSVLNAKQHAREAEIVAQAGQKGHVTIATNMAGRGTDIVLGEGVLELGGLHILGTERHESRRIDNQLRGRSGRQGDPGSSRFYLSLEDDLMRLFGSDRISGLMEKLGLKDGEAIENTMVTRAVESAQKRVEAHHFEIRKTLLDYDNVMNQQREVIYTLRRDMMVEEDLEPVLSEFRNDILDDAYTPLEQADTDTAIELRKALQARLADVFNLGRVLAADAPVPDRAGCEECIHQIFQQLREEAGPLYQDILRYFLLEELDRTWKEHLRNMDALRDGIGLRGYGQKDPKLEYKREGFEMFQSMLFQIREGVFRALTRVHVQPAEPAPAEDAVEEGNAPAEAPQQEAPKAKPTLSLRHKENDDLAYSGSQTTDAGNQPAKAKPRVGRNDPCPCGSGKKYKKCCGMGKV